MQRTGGPQATHGFLSIVVAAAAVAAVGCGGQTGIPDDGSLVDRPIDSPLDPPIDAPAIDAPAPIDATIDAAGCGNDVLLRGYYFDWDGTPANPINIGGSRWTVQGEPTRTTESAPSGLVQLCISPVGVSRIGITGPGGYIGGVLLADPAVISATTTPFVIRGLQSAMATAQYQEFLGMMDGYSIGRSQVMVVNMRGNTPDIPLALAPVLNPPQRSFVNAGGQGSITWAEGDAGKLTLFPNRPITPNTATITSTSQFTGPTEIPLVQNAFTYVLIRSN